MLAPVRDGQMAPLRSFLAGCCAPGKPGHADPANPDINFAALPMLHNIRAFIGEDPSLGDRAFHPRSLNTLFGSGAWPVERVSLGLLGCCDGDVDAFLVALAAGCDGWLAALFAHCEGFGAGDDVLAFMRAHSVKSLASYVNGPGRTVVAVHENAALLAALRAARGASVRHDPAATARQLAALVDVPLTPPAPTPPGHALANLLHLLSVPVAVLALVVLLVWLALHHFWLFALVVLAAVIKMWWLRRIESTDPLVVVPPDPADIAARSAYEDHDSANPFTAIGTIKPGLFRMGLVRVIHYVVDWGARHLFRGGRLGRVGTIHFARWVLIDGGRRVIFTSEYDGSAEAYMDDFINKVGFGLNVSFTNGIGYPRTRWLILDGASDEQRFKYFMRHHQIVTQFWWRAYPGQTTFDLARAARVRAGYVRLCAGEELDELAAARWLAEIAA